MYLRLLVLSLFLTSRQFEMVMNMQVVIVEVLCESNLAIKRYLHDSYPGLKETKAQYTLV